MKSATEVMQQILEHGKENANDSAIRVPFNLAWAPQGDINIIRLPKLPQDVIKTASNAQLAPGTSRGSRHCIRQEDLKHCEFYSLHSPNPLQGPIIRFSKEITITHPEHGDQTWEPGVIAITYQRRYADEIKRIQD